MSLGSFYRFGNVNMNKSLSMKQHFLHRLAHLHTHTHMCRSTSCTVSRMSSECRSICRHFKLTRFYSQHVMDYYYYYYDSAARWWALAAFQFLDPIYSSCARLVMDI
jgi:hypothetical protein